MLMKETYAHELEGQTVIISSMPTPARGEKMPIGHLLAVYFKDTGMKINNVIRIDFEPILPEYPIMATLTLLHVVPYSEDESGLVEERVRVESDINMAAIVQEEKHINGQPPSLDTSQGNGG